MKTIIIKGDAGWSASSQTDIASKPGFLLRIGTRRNSAGQLITTATVHENCGNGVFKHSMGLGVSGLGDFSEQLIVTRPARVTATVLEAQHARALELLTEIETRIAAHYALQQANAKAVEPGAQCVPG
jgi:hypothetical protein